MVYVKRAMVGLTVLKWRWMRLALQTLPAFVEVRAGVPVHPAHPISIV